MQEGVEVESPIRVETEFYFETVDGRIEATYVCSPFALCTRPPNLVARRVAGDLVVDFASEERVPLIYRRATAAE